MNFVVTERKTGTCGESMTDTSNTSDAGNRRGIIAKRVSPLIDREFVLFLIGMRINRMLMVPKWWLVFRAMSRMLTELSADPEAGLAHFRLQRGLRNFMVVQYWDSWEKLEAYAHDPGRAHRPAWNEFYRKIGLNGEVGIWHETYLIKPGQVEAVYGNMPPFGLGNVFELRPSTGALNNAAARLGAGERQGA